LVVGGPKSEYCYYIIENKVSLHYMQTTKVARFNGIGTSKERRGPLSMLNTGGSDGRASASVSCDSGGDTFLARR
jgi:hypothetical protein